MDDKQIKEFVNNLPFDLFQIFYKAFVYRLENDIETKHYCFPGSYLSLIEQQYAKSGEKIKAIKEHRTRTGKGLKDSKDTIDEWFNDNVLLPNNPLKTLTWKEQELIKNNRAYDASWEIQRRTSLTINESIDLCRKWYKFYYSKEVPF